MRTIILLLTFCFTLSLQAQTDGITYQAVIIDNNPQEIPGVDVPSNNLPNTDLKVRFSIIDNLGNTEYQEIQSTTTDPFGMINLTIGRGDVTSESSGEFTDIYWNDEKYLKVEIDLNNGIGMVEFSRQELTYLPYVKHREIIATSNLDVDGATNLNSSLNVNNQSPTQLSGQLTVDGVSDLNSNLTVLNQSPTYLTGDLTVDGLVSFDGPIEVGGDTQLYADLTVDGITNLNNTLNVNNGATTNLSGDLNVDGTATFSDGVFENITVTQNSDLNTLNVSGISTLNNTLYVNGTSSLDGRVIIDVDLPNNNDLTPSSYPLYIKGSEQGIEIEVTGNDGGTPNNSNNFLSFSGANNIRYGRVEGQTTSELTNSFVFIWYATQASLETAFQVAMVVVDLVGIDDGDAAIVEGVEMVDAIANWAGQNTYALANVGVSFSSGFGDYAEWLEKEHLSESFNYGDIVGVTGGKITKYTTQADHYMVISENPIVLGNMPQKNKEENFEKVAFMGQVPVKVLGTVSIGDYIIPSGLNDGIGRAVSPSKLNLKDYGKVVGVAWSASTTKGMSLVNLAVGINVNDTAKILEQQQAEINTLKQHIQTIANYLETKDSAFKIADNKVNSNVKDAITNSRNAQRDVNSENQFTNTNSLSTATATVTDGGRVANTNIGQLTTSPLTGNIADKYRTILQLVNDNPEVVQDIMADARAFLEARNINYLQYEQTRRLVTDREYLVNYLREMAE